MTRNRASSGRNCQDNRSLALRLANFSEEDRARVNSVLSAEKDPARRADLRRRTAGPSGVPPRRAL